MFDETDPPPPPAAKENEMQTIVGGVELEVTHVAADVLDEVSLKRLEKFQPLLGTTERVKVRQVLVSQMPRYGNAILRNDEAAAIEIYTGKEPGWADTLDPGSVNAIADKGLEINLPFFSAWFRRQAKWKEVQTPEAILDLQRKLEDIQTTLRESLSRTSSGATPTATG